MEEIVGVGFAVCCAMTMGTASLVRLRLLLRLRLLQMPSVQLLSKYQVLRYLASPLRTRLPLPCVADHESKSISSNRREPNLLPFAITKLAFAPAEPKKEGSGREEDARKKEKKMITRSMPNGTI